jgi:hypothetical protein
VFGWLRKRSEPPGQYGWTDTPRWQFWRKSSSLEDIIVRSRGATDPNFETGELLSVVPIVQSIEVAGKRLMIACLECYEDGVYLVYQTPPWDFATNPLPEAHHTFAMRDDRGNQYHFRGSGGGGDSRRMRMEARFSPGIAPDARQLAIEVSAVNLRQAASRQERGPSATERLVVDL